MRPPVIRTDRTTAAGSSQEEPAAVRCSESSAARARSCGPKVGGTRIPSHLHQTQTNPSMGSARTGRGGAGRPGSPGPPRSNSLSPEGRGLGRLQARPSAWANNRVGARKAPRVTMNVMGLTSNDASGRGHAGGAEFLRRTLGTGRWTQDREWAPGASSAPRRRSRGPERGCSIPQRFVLGICPGPRGARPDAIRSPTTSREEGRRRLGALACVPIGGQVASGDPAGGVHAWPDARLGVRARSAASSELGCGLAHTWSDP